jgi:hypothetical protein
MEKKEKKQTQTKTSKAYLLTLNQPEYYEKVKNYLYGLESLNYFISTLEKAPETGHEHIHIYAQFKQSIKLSLKKLCGAHVDKCYGSPQQNVDYIHKVKEPEKKGTILDEWGELKLKGGTTIADVKKMTKEDRDDLPIQYYKIVKDINLFEENDIDIDEIYKPELEVYYIWGPSEMDKTKKSLLFAKKKGYQKINMVKYHNGFWLGIGTSKCCLYDDFRDTDMDPNEFINFIDYNKHVMNIKGGSVKNEYQLIIITSVQDPKFIYEYKQVKEETAKQWLRRMTVIDANDENNLNNLIK